MCKCQKAALIWPLVLAILGGVILIASFVVPAVLLQTVNTALYRAATINTMQTNSNDYDHFISNNYDDSAALYYSYYFWNFTNWQDVVQNNSIVPTLLEVGPYTYQDYYQYYIPDSNGNPENGVAFRNAISTATYAQVDQQIFQSALSCATCNDQQDRIFIPSPLYASLFFSGVVKSESAVRQAESAVALPLMLSTLAQQIPTLFNSTLGAKAPYVHALSTSAFQGQYKGLNFYQLFSQNFTSLDPYGARSKYPYNQSFELWAVGPAGLLNGFLSLYGVTTGYDSTVHYIDETLAFDLYSISLPSNIFGCPDFTLSSQTGAACWISYASSPTDLSKVLSHNTNLSITANQTAVVGAWLAYQANYTMSFLFDIEGHVGSSYTTVYRSDGAHYVGYPTIFPRTAPPSYYNNANMFVGKSPYQLLFQNVSLLGGVVLYGKTTFPQEIGLVASSQRSPFADIKAPSLVVTVNTGQVNIDDVDEITAFSTGIPFSFTPPTYQTIYGNPSDIPSGVSATFCNIANLGSTATVNLSISQDYFGIKSHWTPTFPPGHTTSTYGWSNSIVSDNLQYTLFNSILQRQVNFSIMYDTSVQGIDVKRFTVSPSNFEPDVSTGPGYGLISYAVALYFCSGKPIFFTPPRFFTVNLTAAEQAFSTMYDGVSFTSPSWTPLTPVTGADPSTLTAWQDLEPVSGQEVGGSLKEQVNLLVLSSAGAVNLSKAIPGHYMGPYTSTLWPVVWSDKHGELTSSQASTLKAAISAVTAANLLLIIGTIIGGVMMIVSSAFVVLYVRRRKGYNTQTSKIDLNTISV